MMSLEFILLFLIRIIYSDDEINHWSGPYQTDVKLSDHTLTFVSDAQIYVFGGKYANGTASDKLYLVNEEDYSLQDITTTPSIAARYGHAGIKIKQGESTGLLISGGQITNPTEPFDCYELRFNNGTYEWNKIALDGLTETIPGRRKHCMGVNDDGTIIIVYGGEKTDLADSQSLSDLYVYSKLDNNPKWYKATIYYSDNIRPPSVGCKLTFEGNVSANIFRFYLTGGKPETGIDNVHLWQLDINYSQGAFSATFKSISYFPAALPGRESHHAHQLGDSIFLWGGSASTNSFSVINVKDKSWYPLDALSVTIPSLLQSFASTFDSTTNKVLVHGGFNQNNNGTVLGDLYVYNIDPCLIHSTCGSCFSVVGESCLWCASKGRCITGQDNSKVMNFESSSSSSSINTLSPLAESCSVTVTAAANCPGAGNTSISCASYPTCEECIAEPRCGWCQDMRAYPDDVAGCFEGTDVAPYVGSCYYYAKTNDQCTDIKLTLRVRSPFEAEEIIAGSVMYFTWETEGKIDTSKQKYNIYIKYPGSTERLKINTDGELESSGTLVYETDSKMIGNGSVIFTLVEDEGETDLKTLTIQFTKATSKITNPGYGDTIKGNEYLIKWEKNSALTEVDMTVSLSNDTTVISNVFQAQYNYGQFNWSIDETLFTKDKKYKLHLYWHRTGEVKEELLLCDSEEFGIDIKPPYYEIFTNATHTELNPGDVIMISWDSNKFPPLSNVFLMKGHDKETASLVSTLASQCSPQRTELPWVVNVEEDSDDYFFRVEDKDRSLSNDTDFYTIPSSKVNTHFTIRGGNIKQREDMDIPSTTLFYGDYIDVTWEYLGGLSNFSITLVFNNKTENLIANEIANDTFNYSLKIDEKYKHNSGFKMRISAYEFMGGINGTTESFVVLEPGSVGIKSTSGIVMTIIVGLGIIGFILIFYCCCFKKSRLGGFQQI